MAHTLNTTALYLSLRKSNPNMKPAQLWVVACYRTGFYL